MKHKEFYTPEIDGIIDHYGSSDFGTFHCQNQTFKSANIAVILEQMHGSLLAIKPRIDGLDTVWSLWICSRRGPISAYAAISAGVLLAGTFDCDCSSMLCNHR